MVYDQDEICNSSADHIEAQNNDNNFYTGRYNTSRVTPINISRQHRIEWLFIIDYILIT